MRWACVVAAAVLLAACGGTPRGPCAEGTPLGTICGFENPEDVEWVAPAGVLVVSNIRPAGRPGSGGFLAALVPGASTVRRVWPTGGASDVARDENTGDPACPGPPAPRSFVPHGLASVGRLLYVVGHAHDPAGREAVEIFEVARSGADATLVWRGCIPEEPRVIANDLTVAPDGEVVISNYQPSPSFWYLVKGGMLGMSTGDVMGWRRGSGWRHVPGTAAALPNGVAVSADGRALFYAETGTGRVHRVPLGTGTTRAFVDVGGNPDNLSWTPRGTLLVATHTAGAWFVLCNFGTTPCRTSWEVHEIDPTTMTATRRLAHDGSIVGAVASATEADGRIYLGSVFDDRIGVAVVR